MIDDINRSNSFKIYFKFQSIDEFNHRDRRLIHHGMLAGLIGKTERNIRVVVSKINQLIVVLASSRYPKWLRRWDKNCNSSERSHFVVLQFQLVVLQFQHAPSPCLNF